MALDVRFGSGADERGHRQEGLLLGVKQTKRVEKRTLALKVGLSPEFGAHVPECTEDAQTSAVACSGVFGHPRCAHAAMVSPPHRAPLAGCGTSPNFPQFCPAQCARLRETLG